MCVYVCIYSYTFSKVQEHSDTHWKFQRYNLIVEYHSRPCLAPPFIILSHLHLFIKRNIRRVPSIKMMHFGKTANHLGKIHHCVFSPDKTVVVTNCLIIQ